MFQGEDLAGHVRHHRDAVQLCGNPGDPWLHYEDENGCSAFGAMANGRADDTWSGQQTIGMVLLGRDGGLKPLPTPTSLAVHTGCLGPKHDPREKEQENP
jgi:hypothetical protein